MSFKDMVARDIRKTFLNLDEFAEKCAVIYDGVVYKNINFPLELIISDEVQVSVAAPAGLVTWDEFEKKMEEAASIKAEEPPAPETAGQPGQHYFDRKNRREYVCKGTTEEGKYIWEEIAAVPDVEQKIAEHDQDSNSHADIRKAITDLEAKVGGGVVRAERLDISIPAEGWETDADTDGIYPVHLDIANTLIDEDMVPILAVLPASMASASACGLCPTAVTGSGCLRLYAKTMPTSEIAVSAVLIGDVRGCDDIVVPTSGWVAGEDTGGAYPLHIDIASAVASEALTPMLTILPDSLETAGNCGLCPAVQTLDGILRLYAKEAPEKPIRAKLSLLGTDLFAPASTPGNMPIASHTTPGGVILGEDFDITPGGVMSINREKFITADDLVDEEEARQDIVNALHSEDETK